MKHLLNTLAGALCVGLAWVTTLPAADAKAPAASPERIGTYDSRLVAYANFCGEAHQRKLKELVDAAKAARAAGDSTRLKELETALRKSQDDLHRQVFSTGPVDGILADMKTRVGEIQKQTGVARLVSKWDDATLKQLKRAEQVDVTDLLLAEFKLSDEQKKVVEGMRSKKPLPLEKCDELLRKGKL